MSEAATGRWRAAGEGSSERHAGRRVLLRWGRLTLASGLVLLAGPTLAPAAQAAPRIDVTALSGLQPAAASERTASAPAYDANVPVGVTLTTVNPPVPSPDGSVTLSGSVTNRSSNPIDNLHVGLLTTGAPIAGRSQIQELADPTLRPQSSDGREIELPALQAKIGTLAPHATVPFTITAPIGKLQLGGSPDGVYTLGVAALTGTGGFQGHTLGIARTFLPLRGKNSGAKPVKTATLWPLTDNPRVQAQTYVDSSRVEEPVLTDDSLTGSLRPEGRLGQLASIGAANNAGLHLTWMIDPDLIDTVYAMTGNYQVADDSSSNSDNTGANPGCGCVTKGTGSDVASAWLKALQSSLGAANKPDVVSLPYADPDIAALAHNSDNRQALGPVLTATSSSLGLDRLQVEAAHNVAWPYQGYLDSSIAKLAKSMGATQIIVNGLSMPDEGLNYTPNAARSIGGGTTAVIADTALTDIFAGNLSSQSSQTAAIQQFLAETLTISEERPGTQRTVVVQPPRQMSTATAQTLIKALKDAQGGQWLTTTDLNGVVAAGGTPGANGHVFSSGYPASVRSTEPTQQVSGPLGATRKYLDRLQQILTRPDRVREPFGAAMARSASTAWRNQSSLGYAYSGSMSVYAQTLVESVKLLPKSAGVVVPGGNSSAQIAVTVENDLEQQVTNLRVELTSEATPRLHIDSAPVQDVTVPGGRTKSTYRFKVSSTANGSVLMTATLYSTQDPTHPFATQSFTVNITSVSTGVIAVVAGGMLLVVLAGLRLYWKRKKNAALEAAGGANPEDGSENDTEGEAGDASAEANAERPGAGESADPVENEEKAEP